MRIFSKLTGGIAAAALIATAVSPAAARDWNWGPQRHHHDRGPSAGAVIGAVAAVGILAAIASSVSKKKEAEQQRRYDADPPNDRSRDQGRYDDRYGDADSRYDNGRDGPRYDDVRASQRDQDAAVDACVVAARTEAGRNGDYAEIRDVNGVSPSSDGWAVSGSVEQRSGYRATDGWQRNFRCTWQSGRVSGLSLD